MTLRSFLAIANACAWIAVVAIREPLPESFFEFHGGERLAVKVLEVVNLLPFGTIVLGNAVMRTGTTVQTWTRSVLAFVGLLLLTTGQGWWVGTAVARFRVWRQQRRVELDELEAVQR